MTFCKKEEKTIILLTKYSKCAILFSMKKTQVLDFMDSLEKEDEKLGSYVKMYEALSSFLTDFDFLKDSLGLTQQDVAEKMGTTQSAISREDESFLQAIVENGGSCRWRLACDADERDGCPSPL